MMSTVIGGAMLPHAPQFFTMPDTEDKALVAHVREVAADIGSKSTSELQCSPPHRAPCECPRYRPALPESRQSKPFR